MKHCLFISTILLFSHLTFASFVDGTFAIQGSNSTYGPYSGHLIVEGSKISRVVTYEQFQFRGQKVQEVWTGIISNNQLHFELATGEFIRSTPSLQRQVTFHSPLLKVSSNFDNIKKAHTFVIEGQFYSETYGNNEPKLDATWSWDIQRNKIKIEEPKQPLIFDIGYKLAIENVFKWFQKQPELIQYPRGSNFYKNEHFAIYDATDYNFYRHHSNYVRVHNKPIDEISLLESYLRRSAYAFSEHEKMKSFEQETEVYMLNEYGLLRNTRVDDFGNIISQDGDGDGALWSGMYNATLAMKFQATGDAEALANFKRGLKGMFLLMDITGDKTRFARNVRTKTPVLPPNNDWHSGTGSYSHLEWLSEGNNDMFKGIVLSFAWAFHILPPNDPLYSQLSEHALRVQDLKIANRLNNRTLALGLATLATHRADLREEYISSFVKLNKATNILGVDQGFYMKGISDWSGINLNMVSSISEILIAEGILKNFPTGKLNRWERLTGKKTEIFVLNQSRENLMNQWATYATAKRDFFSLAAYAFAYRFGTRGFDYDSNLSHDEAERTWKMRSLWDQSMQKIPWIFREMPIQRSGFDILIDHSLRPDFSISSSPRLPWKSIKDRQPVEYHIQGSEIYPLFEISGCNSNFVWKDGAFNFRGRCSHNLKMASVDYLFVYWMKIWSGWKL